MMHLSYLFCGWKNIYIGISNLNIIWNLEKFILWNWKNIYIWNEVDWNAIYDVWKLMKARKALPLGK